MLGCGAGSLMHKSYQLVREQATHERGTTHLGVAQQPPGVGEMQVHFMILSVSVRVVGTHVLS